MFKADAAHPNSSLQEKLEHLYTLRGGPTIDLTIRPAYYELLERLGNPHQNLPPVIHVAGTNGKGSVIACLKAMYEAMGNTVHTYTSPHLIRFNERISLRGNPIDDGALEMLLDEVIAANGSLPLTFFEVTTAMAFLAFSRQPADILLLETGVGGRLDCTNVIEHPLATIIMPVGMDHCEYLGDSLVSIAREKAGIFKTGSKCITAPQHEGVMSVLRQRSAAVGCDLVAYGDTWRVDDAAGHFVFFWGSKAVHLDRPSLVGPHQIHNAGTALAAMAAIDETCLDNSALATALTRTRWPARLQKLDITRAETGLDQSWELWLDGGHNESAGQILAAQAQLWAEDADSRPLHVIMGMMKTKDPVAFIKPLAAIAASVTVIPIAGEEMAWLPEEMSSVLNNAGISCEISQSLEEALTRLAEKNPGRILVAGSLYLAGQVLGKFSS